MSKQIVIDVDPKGGVKIQTKGYAGSGCQAATAALEKALGVVTSDQKTSEFYASEQAGQGVEQHA